MLSRSISTSLLQRHVDIYRHKVIMGIHHKQIKQLSGTGEPGTQINTNKLLMGTDASNQPDLHHEVEIDLESTLQSIPVDDPNQVALHKEMMSQKRDVQIKEEFIDFAYTESGRSSECYADRNCSVSCGAGIHTGFFA